jgi:hypothetical protein
MDDDLTGNPYTVPVTPYNKAVPTAKTTTKTTVKAPTQVKPTGTTTAKPVKTKHRDTADHSVVDGLIIIAAIVLFVFLLIHFGRRLI